MSRPTVALLCLLLSTTMLPTSSDCDVGDVEAKVVSGPDDDGDLLVSLKVNVINNTESEMDLAFTIQGIDADEFEVFECRLGGKAAPLGITTITDTQYIEASIYDSIWRWRIEDPCR